MKPTAFLDGRVTLYAGDCLAVLPTLAENSIDSVVCDPPYGLEFMGKEWDSFAGWQVGSGFSKPGIGERKIAWPAFTGGHDRFGAANPTCAVCGGRARGKKKCGCDSPDWRVKGKSPDPKYGRHGQMRAYQDWCEAWARETFRVLKPGGHLVAFGSTRTYHRLVCAIEDAGFEIRDQLAWLFGQGFPKSRNISKDIDRLSGVAPKVVAEGPTVRRIRPGADQHYTHVTTEPVSAAAAWKGYGTALKPAHEPIVLARKPLSEGTVAANVLKWGTGALNIDGCRVDGEKGNGVWGTSNKACQQGRIFNGSPKGARYRSQQHERGRWPANVAHDGSDEVLALFPQEAGAFAPVRKRSADKFRNTYGAFHGYIDEVGSTFQGDHGSAARFFYCAKAGASDRLGSRHPTIKPVALMQWLVRLVTPKDGLCLDPFAGTGTTAEAAWREGMRSVLIEREAHSVADIEKRMTLVRATPAQRRRAAKRDHKKHGPLFDEARP